MIQPVNNLNITTGNNLKPVEVPHFTGITKVGKSKADSFQPSAKSAAKNGCDFAVENGRAAAKKASSFTSDFKKTAAETFDAAKTGAREGAKVVADATEKGVRFTGSLIKSLGEDISAFVREKGAKTITEINNVL